MKQTCAVKYHSLLIVLFTGLFTVAFSFTVKAQGFTNSSEVYRDPLLKDSVAIGKMIATAYSLRETATDSSGKLYQRTLTASKSINYRYGIAESYLGVARNYNLKNQQDKVIEFLRLALPYCGNDTRGLEQVVSIYSLMSESYYYMGRNDSCAWYRYEALNMIENNAGITNSSLKLKVYSKILQFWMNAHEDVKNDRYIQHIMGRINAIEKTAIAKNDSNMLASIYFQKAGYYHNAGKNDSSRYYSQKNIDYVHALHSIPSMPMASYVNMAITWLDDKRPDEAIASLKKVFAEVPEQGKAINRYLVFADIFIGEAYCMQQKFKEAIAITEPALEKAVQFNIVTLTDHAHKTLADAYHAEGNYKKEAIHRQQYAILRDSLMKTEKMDLIYNVDMKYRIADKNKEIAEKELEIAKNESRLKTKNLWIGGISAGLVLLLFAAIFLYVNNRQKQKLQAEKINNLGQQMKIEQLNAMIKGEEKERSRIARELHDGMGGTLASIRLQVGAIAKKEGGGELKDILQMLEEASADLRKSAHNLMPEILLQEGLPKAAELFCSRISMGHTLDIRFEALGEFPVLERDFSLIVYRIIQELINNIIKHAQATQALVQLNYHNDVLSVTVEDNGKGMNEETATNGMGIKTMKERIKLLHGQVDINSSPENGTAVYIEFINVAKQQNSINADAD